MHNGESVLENKTQKILWDFVIQTNYQISARRPGQVIVKNKIKKEKKKENLSNSGIRHSV